MGIYIYIYIYKVSICLCVCLCVCSCLNAGLTAAPINLKFGMHTHIRSDCAIGYIILTFEVIKGHFRSNKFLCVVLCHFYIEFSQLLYTLKTECKKHEKGSWGGCFAI